MSLHAQVKSLLELAIVLVKMEVGLGLWDPRSAYKFADDIVNGQN